MESNLGNRIDEEAVHRAIRLIWPLPLQMSELLHCLGGTALFSSLNEAVFFINSACNRSNTSGIIPSCDRCSLSQNRIVYKDYALRIPENRNHDLSD